MHEVGRRTRVGVRVARRVKRVLRRDVVSAWAKCQRYALEIIGVCGE